MNAAPFCVVFTLHHPKPRCKSLAAIAVPTKWIVLEGHGCHDEALYYPKLSKNCTSEHISRWIKAGHDAPPPNTSSWALL